MEINYLILAHKNPWQLKRMIDALQSKDARFYIHIDRNANIIPFQQQLSKYDHVCFLSKEYRHYGIWGDIGIVQATLALMRQALQENRNGYCVLLSGQDYPIKNKGYINTYLENHYGTNFIEIFPLSEDRWEVKGTDRLSYYKINLSFKRGDYILLPPVVNKAFFSIPTLKKIVKGLLRGKNVLIPALLKNRELPLNLTPYGGAQWWAFPIETVQKIMTFVDEHPEYVDFHRYTLLADEIFFHTIFGNLFSLNEANVVNPPLTYTNWHKENVPLPVTFTWEDFTELTTAGDSYLFARKFDEIIDEKIFDLLDEKNGNMDQDSQTALPIKTHITN